MNMVVGGFFSEMGTDLIRSIHDYFGKDEETHRHFLIDSQWTHSDFNNAKTFAGHLRMEAVLPNSDLEGLREFLKQKRSFILGLLQNPILLEHDKFSDLL
jgi:hypothetical protein